ncbi:MAG: SPOR domain-containing protein [Gammaproteobacteria bacterium]|nr:SPOR domain-containing protein [Gammaproteobacteria bacterium]
MPRDYKPAARRRRRSARSKSSPRWSWLLGGLIAGILASYAVYLTATRNVADKAEQAAQKPAAPAPKTAPPKTAATDDKEAREKARFDFYTLLPEMEVKIGKDTLDAARGGNSRKPESNGPYVLQVGSFRSYGEADNLKARLALIGVQASIQTVIISDDNTWYRVRVGPYKNLKDLEQARTALQRNDVEYMLLGLGREG